LQYSKSRDLKPSRPRLAKMGLETRLETETKSRDSITDPIAIRIRMRHWLNMKQTGSGSIDPPVNLHFLKTYTSIACTMMLIHDKCAVDGTTLR